MGNTARALGAGAELTFDGKAYRLAPWTYGIQARFETYLECAAVDAVKRARKRLDPDEYEVQLARVLRDVASGVYSFGSDVVHRALQSLPHLKHLLLLMLQDGNPDDRGVNKDLVDRIVEANLDDALQAMTRANADPNATPPAPAPAG